MEIQILQREVVPLPQQPVQRPPGMPDPVATSCLTLPSLRPQSAEILIIWPEGEPDYKLKRAESLP